MNANSNGALERLMRELVKSCAPLIAEEVARLMTADVASLKTSTARAPARDPILTVKEVAEWLRVSTGTLYTWRALGTDGGTDPGPESFKFGDRVVYLQSKVQDYIDQQLAETGSKAEWSSLPSTT